MAVTFDCECFVISDDNPIDRRNHHPSILEFVVQDTILQSGLGSFLVAVPFVGILLVGLFRLDEIIAVPKRRQPVKRPACGCDENGHLLLSDPDGRPWRA